MIASKFIFFTILVFFPLLSQASPWTNLWLRPDQQAARLLSHNQPQEAAQKFEDPAWRAVAEYRAGDYDAALKDFSRLDTTDSNYNRGNTLAQLGRYQDALAAYDQSLKQDPKNKDAQYNRAIVEKLLQQPHQQDQPSQNDSSKNKDSSQKSDKNGSQKPSSPNQKNPPDPSQQHSPPDQPPQPSQNNQSSSDQGNQKQDQNQTNPSQNKAQNEVQNQVQQNDQQEGQSEAAKQTSASALQNPQQEQAMQQWLQSIPDDPGGLLRQKFLRDHQQKMTQSGV